MTAKKTASVKTKKKTAAKKKAVAGKRAPSTPKAAAKTKKTAAAKKKAGATKPTKKAGAAKPTKKAAAPKKKAAAAVKKRATRPISEVPPSRPSERVLAIVAQLPVERPLTDEEREAMAKCAHTAHTALAALAALAALETDGPPEVIVTRIGGFLDDIRAGRRPEPSSQDIRLGLGVLWGEQVRAQVGWRWVHLSYPNGFASYALVPDDRAFACFPLNRLTDLLRSGAETANTSVPLFDSIRLGTLPARRENAYLVIG